MINISLGEKEKRILEIAYLNYYCGGSGSKEHKKMSELKKLAHRSSAELDKMLEGKKLEKLSKRYKSILLSSKIELPKYIFYKLYGAPFLKDDAMNVSAVKKLLLVNMSEIQEILSAPEKIDDADLLEIAFFYCLEVLKHIADKTDRETVLKEIEDWYENYYPAVKRYFKEKPTKEGFPDSRKWINETVFEQKVILNKDYEYFCICYKRYKGYIEAVHDFFGKVFHYDQYFQNKEFKYLLASLMGVDVCPYCNRQYISILPEEKRTTATFDHYKRKEVFPLFSLSLYNLIPACSVCNSMFKGTKDLEHLYPWKEGDGGIRFTYDKEGEDGDVLREYYEKNNCDHVAETKIKIDLAAHGGHGENSVRIFKLEDVYQVHNSYAGRLIAKAMKYETGSYKEAIFKLLQENNILTDEALLDEHLYGMNFKGIDVNEASRHIPLFKLSSDLIEEIRSALKKKEDS